MKYFIYGACQSNIGRVRKNNEDNYLFNNCYLSLHNKGSKIHTAFFDNTIPTVHAVFDGMGGEADGEMASFLATTCLKECFKDGNDFSWASYVRIANKIILSETKKNQTMGTTIAGVLFTKGKIIICNLGDSRIYGYKNNRLCQLSFDDTNEVLIKRLNAKQQVCLTQHLGLPENEIILEPHIIEKRYHDFDKILICSDGLTNMIKDKEIATILSQKKSSKKTINLLMEKALKSGGKDNITIMLFNINKQSNIAKKILLYIVPILIILILLLWINR